MAPLSGLVTLDFVTVLQGEDNGSRSRSSSDSVVASTSCEALEMTECTPYDAIFMDCHGPELGGYEAVAAIRAREHSGMRAPIDALTVIALDEDRARCLSVGKDAFFAKSTVREELRRIDDGLARESSPVV